MLSVGLIPAYAGESQSAPVAPRADAAADAFAPIRHGPVGRRPEKVFRTDARPVAHGREKLIGTHAECTFRAAKSTLRRRETPATSPFSRLARAPFLADATGTLAGGISPVVYEVIGELLRTRRGPATAKV